MLYLHFLHSATFRLKNLITAITREGVNGNKIYITNKRNDSMEIELTLFAILFVIIVIALVFYFTNKKSQTTVPEEDPLSMFGPQIEVTDFSLTLNPDGNKDVEGYAAEGDVNYTELSKNVDLSITWKNRNGFQNVNELLIKRFVGVNEKASVTLKRTDPGNEKYFQNFTSIESAGVDVLTYTFSNPTYNVLGDNRIKIYYKKEAQYIELTPSDLSPVKITAEQLALTMELLSPEVYIYTPTTESTVTIDPTISRTGYYIYMGNVAKAIQEYIPPFRPHGRIYLVPSTKNTKVKLKLQDTEEFINYISTTKEFSFGPSGTEFSVVRGITDGNIRLKVGDLFIAVENDKLIMIDPKNITTAAVDNSLDIRILIIPLQHVNCVGHWNFGEDIYATGSRTDTYEVTTQKSQYGSGCIDPDATTPGTIVAHGATRTTNVDFNCTGSYDYTKSSACQASETDTTPKSCGGGKKYFSFVKTREKKNNGTCPAEKEWVPCASLPCNTGQTAPTIAQGGGGAGGRR